MYQSLGGAVECHPTATKVLEFLQSNFTLHFILVKLSVTGPG